jgi:hypothetical protein
MSVNDSIPRFAVVATHSRPVELLTLARTLSAQTDYLIVVDNASDPPVDEITIIDAMPQHDRPARPYPRVWVLRDPEQPPNLSRLWNVGLAFAESWARCCGMQRWDVAILNDDALMPEFWYDVVARGLVSSLAPQGREVAACCTPAYSQIAGPILKIAPDGDLFGRMTPWAFVARGELGMRFDERLRWWWGDTLFDWTAREVGGMLMVPGPIVINSRANESTVGVLAEQAGKDRATFEEITGKPAPW